MSFIKVVVSGFVPCIGNVICIENRKTSLPQSTTLNNLPQTSILFLSNTPSWTFCIPVSFDNFVFVEGFLKILWKKISCIGDFKAVLEWQKIHFLVFLLDTQTNSSPKLQIWFPLKWSHKTFRMFLGTKFWLGTLFGIPKKSIAPRNA